MTMIARQPNERASADVGGAAGVPVRDPAVPELLVPGRVQRRAGGRRRCCRCSTSGRSSCCSAATTAWRACSMRSARTWARTSAYGGAVVENTHPLSVPLLALRRRGPLRRGAVREQDPAAGEAHRLARVCEKNGLIMVWHHMDGRAADVRDPGPAGVRRPGLDAVRTEALEDPHAQPGDGGERRRLRALQVRARHAGAADDARRDRRPHPARAVAGELHDAAGHGRGRHRVGLATASASGRRASRASSRRCSSASVTPIDGEYVDVRFSFTVKKMANEDATSGRRRGVHQGDRAAAGAGHPDLGEQGDEDAAGAVRRRRAGRHLPPLGEAVLRDGAGTVAGCCATWDGERRSRARDR